MRIDLEDSQRVPLKDIGGASLVDDYKAGVEPSKRLQERRELVTEDGDEVALPSLTPICMLVNYEADLQQSRDSEDPDSSCSPDDCDPEAARAFEGR